MFSLQTSQSVDEEEIVPQVTLDRQKSTKRELSRRQSLRSHQSILSDAEEEDEGGKLITLII